MGVFDTDKDFRIRIGVLKDMGFQLSHWGTPDWYKAYKTKNIYTRVCQKACWYPSKKFYEMYDEDLKLVVMYFPKGFEGYVNWNAMGFPYGWSPKDSGIVVAYHDCNYGDSTWEPVYMKARTIIDIECAIMEGKKRHNEYYDYE